MAEKVKEIFLDLNEDLIKQEKIDLAVSLNLKKQELAKLDEIVGKDVGEKIGGGIFDILKGFVGAGFDAEQISRALDSELRVEVDRNKLREEIAEIQALMKKGLSGEGGNDAVVFSINLEVFNKELKTVQDKIKSLQGVSISLFDEDEQLERAAQQQIISVRQVANEALKAQQNVTLALGTQGRKLNKEEINAIEAKDRAIEASFLNLSKLNADQLNAAIRASKDFTDIELELGDALLAIHQKLEEDKAALTEKGAKDRAKVQLEVDKETLRLFQQANQDEADREEAVSRARKSLTELGAGARPEKTDVEKIAQARNIALEKSVALINAEGDATGANTDALIRRAEVLAEFDETELNDARLTAKNDELLIIEAQIAAIARRTEAEQIATDLSKQAIESQNELWKNLTNDGINLFSNALAASIVRQKNLLDTLKVGVKSITQQVIATIIKIAIQKGVSALLSGKIEAISTKNTVIQSRIRAHAFATEASAAALGSAGASVIAGNAALAIGVPTSLALTAPLRGIAHGGLESVPQTGTFLLEKGEMVSKKQTVDKLDAFMRGSASRQPTVKDINVNIGLNISALDGQSVLGVLDQAEGKIKSMAVEGLMQFFEQRGIQI